MVQMNYQEAFDCFNKSVLSAVHCLKFVYQTHDVCSKPIAVLLSVTTLYEAHLKCHLVLYCTDCLMTGRVSADK